jgi:formate hydrogenlyase transcriptional activator
MAESEQSQTGLDVADIELKHRLDQLRLLLDVNNSIVSHLDLRELFKAISPCLRQVINYDAVGMTLYDAATNQLRVYVLESQVAGATPIAEGVRIPLEVTPAGRAFTSRQTLLLSRAELERFPSPMVQRALAEGMQTSCVAPLISHGRALGTLAIASLQENAFSKADAELLTQIANQIAITVENALNFEAVRLAETQMANNRDRLQLLLKINNAIVSHLDLHDLMKAVSACLREVMHHDFAGITLYDAESNVLRPYAYTGDLSDRLNFIDEGMPVPLEGTPLGMVFTSGRPLLIARPDPEKFTSEIAQRIIAQGVNSGCAVPLIARGRKLGVLGIGSFQENAFTEGDVEMLTQVADQIAIAVDNALAYREIEALKNKLSAEKLYLEQEIHTAYNFDQIIGSSAAFKRILKQVGTVAPTDSTVLIQGETGTGKEIIARAIHNVSTRKARTLVKLNCAAIPTGLLEAELFGHEKGAFTGAIAQRIGRFELAHKGTLFLDEVGEIPLELQPKLLRVLQEREFERLGSTRTSKVDVRLIAATNRALEQMVAERRFRDDLYYRLNVFPITIPPLRERREDIPLLVRFFASRFARRMNKRIETIPVDAVTALQEYHWPGNIRELENFIERAVIVTQGKELQIPLAAMKPPVQAVASTTAQSTSASIPSAGATESASLESIAREHIVRVLNETNWVVSGPEGAAARLGLKRTTLQARMKKLGIARHRTAP